MSPEETSALLDGLLAQITPYLAPDEDPQAGTLRLMQERAEARAQLSETHNQLRAALEQVDSMARTVDDLRAQLDMSVNDARALRVQLDTRSTPTPSS